MNPVCPIETPAGQAAATIAWDLLSALRSLKDEQYRWLCEVRGSEVITRSMEFEESFARWRQTADQQIAELGREDGKLRAWLIATLLNESTVSNPATYLYHAHTAFGNERIRLEVIGDGAQEQQTQPETEASQWSLDKSYIGSLAKETGLHINVSDLKRSIKLSEATQQKLWVVWNQPPTGPGFAYCLTCSCPSILFKADCFGRADIGSFQAFSRYFHTNPFLHGTALHHFRTVHTDPLPGGISDLVRKHAVLGKSFTTRTTQNAKL